MCIRHKIVCNNILILCQKHVGAEIELLLVGGIAKRLVVRVECGEGGEETPSSNDTLVDNNTLLDDGDKTGIKTYINGDPDETTKFINGDNDDNNIVVKSDDTYLTDSPENLQLFLKMYLVPDGYNVTEIDIKTVGDCITNLTGKFEKMRSFVYYDNITLGGGTGSFDYVNITLKTINYQFLYEINENIQYQTKLSSYKSLFDVENGKDPYLSVELKTASDELELIRTKNEPITKKIQTFEKNKNAKKVKGDDFRKLGNIISELKKTLVSNENEQATLTNLTNQYNKYKQAIIEKRSKSNINVTRPTHEAPAQPYKSVDEIIAVSNARVETFPTTPGEVLNIDEYFATTIHNYVYEYKLLRLLYIRLIIMFLQKPLEN